MWFNKKERTYQEIIDEIHSNLGENKKEVVFSENFACPYLQKILMKKN